MSKRKKKKRKVKYSCSVITELPQIDCCSNPDTTRSDELIRLELQRISMERLREQTKHLLN